MEISREIIFGGINNEDYRKNNFKWATYNRDTHTNDFKFLLAENK